MGLGNLNPGCGCCGECIIGTDDFNGANSTDLGANWREVDGDWERASNALRVGTANAFIRHLSAEPDGTPDIGVQVRFRAADADDEALVMLPAWADDEWVAGEFTVGADCGTMRLVDFAGNQIGPEMVVKDLVPDVWHTAEICYFFREYPDSSFWIIRITTASGVFRWMRVYDSGTVPSTADADGFTAGLGTGALTALMEFDDFTVFETRTDDDPNCPTCLPTTTCDIGGDSFNRADSDDPGCEWEEETGDEDIVSNKLKFMSTGRIRYLVPHPNGTHWYMQGIVDGSLNDNVYFIADYDPGAGTYVYGRVRLSDFAGTGLLEIGTEAGPIVSSSLNTFDDTYTLCITPEHVAFGTTTDKVSTSEYTLRDGRYSALQASTNVTIDDFVLKMHRSEEFPDCPDCYGDVPCLEVCESGNMSAAYLVTMPTSGWTDGLVDNYYEAGESVTIETNHSDPFGGQLCEIPEVEESCGGNVVRTSSTPNVDFLLSFSFVLKNDGRYYARVIAWFYLDNVNSCEWCWRWEADLGTEKPDCPNIAGLSLDFVEANEYGTGCFGLSSDHPPNPTPGPVILDAL